MLWAGLVYVAQRAALVMVKGTVDVTGRSVLCLQHVSADCYCWQGSSALGACSAQNRVLAGQTGVTGCHMVSLCQACVPQHVALDIGNPSLSCVWLCGLRIGQTCCCPAQLLLLAALKRGDNPTATVSQFHISIAHGFRRLIGA